jgi:hypothetical protein
MEEETVPLDEIGQQLTKIASDRTGLDNILREGESVFEDFSPNMRPNFRTANVLFAAHTHCVDTEGKLIFDSTPRLAILSDRPGSGKTTILELVRLLSYRGHKVSARNTTAPGLIRAIQEEKASLFLDQIERMLTHSGNGFANRIDIMETGYERTGKSLNADGFHSTFAPLAMAGLQSMFLGNPNLEALRTRSILIFMEPIPEGLMDEDDCYQATFHESMVAAIGRKMNSEIKTMQEVIKAAKPEMSGVRLRQRQIWRPLFMIAEAAGGLWPEKARSACREIALGLETSRKELSPAEQLWNDIRLVAQESEGNLTIELIVDEVMDAGLPSSKYWASHRQGSNAVGRVMRET